MALTREQWEERDYRQVARELDEWARAGAASGRGEDSTEYVAKIGISGTGSVVVMNRAHDRVLVPPPARAALAALALADQPFGFGQDDVALLRRVAGEAADGGVAAGLRDLAERLAGLLPPANGP